MFKLNLSQPSYIKCFIIFEQECTQCESINIYFLYDFREKS